VGEIGVPRREFLHDLRWWEVHSIIRGYRQRDRLKHQLIAECAYAAMYAMRDSQGKTVEDMFPMLFEDDDYDEPPISEEDVADMQAMMEAFNNNLNEQNNKQL
jgi:hypothetical protein